MYLVISVNYLDVHDMKLNNCELRSLTKMLDRRVINLTLVGDLGIEKDYKSDLPYFDPSILANYDGQGQCGNMLFVYTSENINKIKEHLSPWAHSKGWNIKKT